MKRRAFVVGGTAVAAQLAWPAFADPIRRTPGQILGPYYPVTMPADADIDLTRVTGRAGRAAGEYVRIGGGVFNEAGQPVPNARIEIWQADAKGHYHHVSDKTAGAADPDFQGCASFFADGEGRYEFITIKPAPYPDDGAGGMRAPHIHFQVTGKVNRLVTQMYFSGERLNESDRVLAFAGAGRGRLIASPLKASGSGGLATAKWDIVLRDG